MVISGISNKVKTIKEGTWASGTGTEKVFGHNDTWSWVIDSHMHQDYDLATDAPNPTSNVDGVLDINGKASWKLTDGRELECIFGTLTDGTGSFTLAVAKVLPTYTVETVLDDTNYLKILGLKFSKITISLVRDQDVMISGDWYAKNFADGIAFTPTAPSRNLMTYLDGKLQLDGADQTGIEDVTITIDRKVVPKRFIEATALNEKRLVTALQEGVLTITMSGHMTTRKALVDKMRGGTSMSDTRSDGSAALVFGNGTNTLTLSLTGVRVGSIGRDIKKDDETVLMEFGASALGISGSGTY